ncbi:MAG TPA: hypothetical protein VHZ31_08215 [Solirubrobacteraceae bacterium]|jgi:hypothetical protein|nr:hypothetical protein [Solirubrobacteraceae bacterium]
MPRTSEEAAARLVAAVDALGCEEDVGVVVQNQTAAACTLRRRRSAPTIVAALDFVEASDDELLRGTAALQLAAMRDPQLTRSARHGGRLQLALTAVSAAVPTLALPTVAAAAAGSSIGFSAWLSVAAAAALSRTRLVGRQLAHADVAAVGLAGDPDAVARALRAMHAWRAARSPFAAAVTRCPVPVPPDAHELERATAIEAAAIVT